MENALYNWTFSDKKERSSSWYIIFLSIMIWLVIWWFLTKQYGMSIAILLVSGVGYFIENNSEETVQVSIWELWIMISNNFYEYAKIQSYGFIYSGENAYYLRLKILKSWLNQLDLQVNNTIAKELGEILPNYIREADSTELSTTEKIIKLLKL